jgi:hypothetical protein
VLQVNLRIVGVQPCAADALSLPERHARADAT